MLTSIALILAGFFLLMWSADLLVDNASELALRLGISTFLVGIIVIGFGTSAPEMFVSAMAALENKGNLALGNALGSNITNIGLVLGSAALIKSIRVSRSSARIDITVVIMTGVLSIILISDGLLSRLDGVILLSVLVGYLVWSALYSKDSMDEVTIEASLESSHEDHGIAHPTGKSTMTAALFTIGSIILLVIASRILVIGAVDIATRLGIGELVVGLTIVAIGTSLPELAAAIAAARKGAHDMIIGNIIGSNIFNTLGVLGITGVIRSTEIDTTVLGRDFPVMFAFTVLMLIFALSKGKFSRREGGIMLAGYFSYVGYLVFTTL